MAVIDLDAISLKSGSHARRGKNTVCLLEATAWLAGEKHTDKPECVSLVLAAFGRSWNDGMHSDAEREQLKQYIPLLIGTVSTPEIEEQRAYMALDWLARTCAPAWLKLAGLDDHADALLRLEPLVSAKMTALAQTALSAAESAARSAAESTALSTALSAALSAALSTALSTARFAALSAAESAARSAAESAALSTAESALKPTVQELLASAHDLYHRMIALSPAPIEEAAVSA